MKKLLISALLLPIVAFAEPQVRSEIKILCGSGQDSAIKIISANQSAPFITINDGTNTLFNVNNTGSISLSGTNGQIVFGSTNTAPVTTNVVVAWVAVSVKGDTNAYRLPLYK